MHSASINNIRNLNQNNCSTRNTDTSSRNLHIGGWIKYFKHPSTFNFSSHLHGAIRNPRDHEASLLSTTNCVKWNSSGHKS